MRYPRSLITIYKILRPASNITVGPPIKNLIMPLHSAPIGSVLVHALAITLVYITLFGIIARGTE